MAAFCKIYIAPSNPNVLILQNLGPITFSPPPPNNPKPPLSPPPPPNAQCSEKSPLSPTRRRILSLSVVGFLSSLEQPFPRFLFLSKALASQMLQLDKYTDSKEGFALLVPSSWVKVDKAGATVLFEDANKRANSVGVVVTPTRISSLGEFGTPRFVADKLIQAERRKESTKEAEVISV